jgi:hypothetical protein
VKARVLGLCQFTDQIFRSLTGTYTFWLNCPISWQNAASSSRRFPMASIEGDTPRTRGVRDAPHQTPVTPEEDLRTVLINRVSWGAVLAGVVVALVIQLILNLLGLGIGASTLNPAGGDTPSAATFSIGAGLWWALSGIIAALAGGYAAGRLAGQPKETTGAWHGLIAWALTTLIVFYLLTTTIGGIVGGAFRTLGTAASGTAQTLGTAAQIGVQAAAPGLSRTADPFAEIERSIRGAGGADAAALRDAAVSAVRAVTIGDPQQVQDARERAAQALAKTQNVTIEEARSQVERYEQQYRQAVEQAKQQALVAAETAAAATARAGLFGALALILGAIAAWFGGRLGAVDPTITSASLRATRREPLH